MKHRALIPPSLAIMAAIALCALLVCFYPQDTLSVLSGGRSGADPHALTVSADGQVLDCSNDAALLSALADSPCVRLPGLPSTPDDGEIRLYYGDMCAVISPRGGVLRSSGRGGTYLILGAGPDLYQRVRNLVTLRA